LFDNYLAEEFLKDGKHSALLMHMGLNAMRLQSGMTAEEVDAVKKRAKEA